MEEVSEKINRTILQAQSPFLAFGKISVSLLSQLKRESSSRMAQKRYPQLSEFLQTSLTELFLIGESHREKPTNLH